MAELSLITVSLLVVTGFIAGVINTLAGGGSNLTIPALMVMGLPADVANATNRVGVFLQSVAGVRGFHRHGKLDSHDTVPVLIPNLLGGLLGAVLAAAIPVSFLKPLLLGTMIAMSLLILLRPAVVAPPLGTPPLSVRDRPGAWAEACGVQVDEAGRELKLRGQPGPGAVGCGLRERRRAAGHRQGSRRSEPGQEVTSLDRHGVTEAPLTPARRRSPASGR